MKNLILGVFFTLTATANTYAQTLEEHIQSLEAQYSMAVGQASKPSSSSNAYDVIDWCYSTRRELERALDHFRGLVASGQNTAAFRSLQNALHKVSTSRGFKGASPFTKIAADRALLISRKIQGLQADVGALYAIEVLTLNILKYDNQFDINYYVPYRYYNCGRYGCTDSYVASMQRQALEFSRAQIYDLLARLTTNVGGGAYPIRPIGHPSIYLTSAEVVSIFVASDLKKNIFSAQFPCAIDELQRVGLNLRAFNRSGPGAGYPNVPVAVNSSAVSLQDVANDLVISRYCH